MQRRERHLARPRQVQRVVGEPVDLLLGVGQEAGAEQRLLAHEHGRDDRLEARGRAAARAPSARAPARAARGRPSGRRSASPATRAPASMSISRPGQLEVVARAASRRGSPTSRSVVSSSAARRVGRVGQRGERRLELGLDRRELLAQRLRRGARPPASRRSPRAASSPAFFARAIACEASFWRARSPSTSGSSSRRRSSSSSAASSRASEPSRAARQRGAHRRRGRRRIAFRSSTGPPTGVGRARCVLRPSTSRRSRATFCGVLADDDVLRHRAGREAAVADRVEDVLARAPCAGRSSGRPCTRASWP